MHAHRDTFKDLRWQVFTYGAGFVAALLHWALHDPRIAADLLRRLPRLARHSPGRPAERSASSGIPLPPGLRRLELWGYAYGPLAYARAVWRHRRLASRGAP